MAGGGGEGRGGGMGRGGVRGERGREGGGGGGVTVFRNPSGFNKSPVIRGGWTSFSLMAAFTTHHVSSLSRVEMSYQPCVGQSQTVFELG